MKTILLFMPMLLVCMQLQAQPERKIVILHTNDLHSRLTGYAPESAYTPMSVNDDATRGGFARIAGIIGREKAAADGKVCVVDDGDFMMGTLFPGLESETGFQLRLMKRMGYDVVGLGNHEFDFGPSWIAGVIRTSASKGEIPVMLSSNTEFSTRETGDDDFEKLFTDRLVLRKAVIEKGGLKIGLFSIIGKEADRVAPRARPLKFEKQAAAARRMVKELKNEKCDLIICLSHSGVTKEKDGSWGGEDVDLAKKVSGINVIISGHTHTRLEKPVMVNGVPVVQTGEFGQNVGRLSLVISGGKVLVEDYRLIPVDDSVAGDRDIQQLIGEQKEKITARVLRPLGLSYESAVAETAFRIEGNDTGDFMNSNLGPLVADAIHYYVNRENGSGTDLSMVAAGMLFDRILPGLQTVPDLFRVMPLGSGNDNVPGYPLSRLYVTGKELKSILEILQVAYKSSAENYCYYSGIRVEYDPGKGMLRKIKKIDVIGKDGSARTVDFSKKNRTLYSITANSYMLEFIGIIKKMSFGIINVVPKDAGGNKMTDMKLAVIDMDDKTPGIQEGKEWLALISYLGSMKDADGDNIPDVDPEYAAPVRCFFPVKDK